MRVLFLLDEVFATRERPLIERLEVGLADEGVRVVRAVPDTLEDAAPGGFFVETASYTREGLVLSRWNRARRLLDAVAPTPDKPIDVIHAMGGGAWTMAATLGRLRSCPVALEVWRTGLAPRAKRIRAALGPEIPVWLLCPDQGTVHDLGTAGLGEGTRLTPWGVHATDEPRTLLPGEVAASIVVVGSGRDGRAFAAAMEGLSRALPSTDDARVYIDADAAHRARLWGVLERLSLTERASLIPGMEARRELALLSDVLLVPEALGEHRTIVLDAMGAGMAVVAAGDPRVSWLVEGTTARLVGSAAAPGTPEQWAAAIRDTVLSPERARVLGASARAHVLEHFKASGHVAAVMGAYATMTSTGTAGSIGI